MASRQDQVILLSLIISIAMVVTLMTSRHLEFDHRPKPLRRYLRRRPVERVFAADVGREAITYRNRSFIRRIPQETRIRSLNEKIEKLTSEIRVHRTPPPVVVKSSKKSTTTTTTTTIKSNECRISFVEEIVPKRPMINLRNNMYLLPMLSNGPNNQLMSFRESMYLAIRLNRTLVVPQFHKHKYDSQSYMNAAIHAQHRVDLNSVNKFIPVITMEEFKKRCNSLFNAVFLAHTMDRLNYLRIYEYYGLTFDKDFNYDHIKDVEFPKEPKFIRNALYVNSSKADLEKAYGTERDCAIFPQPFNTILLGQEIFPQYKKDLNSGFDLQKLNDTMLFSEITRYAAPPPHITRLATEFIKNKIHGKLTVGVHWRFDRHDWGLKCKGKKAQVSQLRLLLCDLLLSLSEEDVANAIHSKVQNITTLEGISKTIYIAAPPSETEFIQKAREYLEDWGYQVLVGEDIREYWGKSHKNCNWMWPNLEDLISNTEMSICQNALVFFGSISSSWTMNVEKLRPSTIPYKYRKYDDSIFRLARKVTNFRVKDLEKRLQEKKVREEATTAALTTLQSKLD